MSDIKLFRLIDGVASPLPGKSFHLEKPLQTLIEKNLEPLLGISFVATEYSTGKVHGGRIDTLGIDENSVPVILEYKRSSSENVINQGLFYLDWLMDHQADFQLLVQEKLGIEKSKNIDWSAPRLICIAADFTKYDDHAVQQIDRNIELIRYRQFGEELILFDLVNAVSAARPTAAGQEAQHIPEARRGGDKLLPDRIRDLSEDLKVVLDELDTFLISLGDDVTKSELKLYIAYKRMRNFVCITVYGDRLALNVSLSPDDVDLITGFTRDMRGIGHWGTGDLEISIRDAKDLERALPLLTRSYNGR